MRRRGLKYNFIFIITFLMVPFGLISIESQEFDDFFDAQDEREIEKIQEKEASIKSVSEKYILTFFYIGNQACSNDAAKHVLNLAIKYNWLTYAISLDGILSMKKHNSLLLFAYLLTSVFFMYEAKLDADGDSQKIFTEQNDFNIQVIRDGELLYVGDEVFILGEDVFRYPKVAMAFGLYMYSSESRSTSIHLVSYVHSSSGLYHVGWYADGLILTCMEKQKIGKQIIINNDQVIGISYLQKNFPSFNSVGFRHQYNLGYVGTTEGYQTLTVSNKSLWPADQPHFK